MNYYFDTEFVEGPQRKKILGFPYGWTKPTIDLISIGIVAEDGMKYYAISKDFNLSHAWKNEWIRENVLWPIFKELKNKSIEDNPHYRNQDPYYKYQTYVVGDPFTEGHLRSLIQSYGKTNDQIAKDIQQFVWSTSADRTKDNSDPVGVYVDHFRDPINPIFYAYYADYDWVVFCQLFGTMMDLPKGFPMYCRDLKQMIDEKVHYKHMSSPIPSAHTFNDILLFIKNDKHYPKQENEHNALADAKWNRDLHKFLINL